jgi:hypothetical protein
MEGVRRGPPNAVRHHGEEKEEEIGIPLGVRKMCNLVMTVLQMKP